MSPAAGVCQEILRAPSTWQEEAAWGRGCQEPEMPGDAGGGPPAVTPCRSGVVAHAVPVSVPVRPRSRSRPNSTIFFA